jgi:hypothetical protein
VSLVAALGAPVATVSEVAEWVSAIIRWMSTRLDDAPDEVSDTAWVTEIERRARDAIANPEDDIPWETVRAELHAPTGE